MGLKGTAETEMERKIVWNSKFMLIVRWKSEKPILRIEFNFPSLKKFIKKFVMLATVTH